MKNATFPAAPLLFLLVGTLLIGCRVAEPYMSAGAGKAGFKEYDTVEEYIAEWGVPYSEMAREKSMEGDVIAAYTVGTDGSLGNITLVKDIGGNCGVNLVNALYVFNHVARLKRRPHAGQKLECRVSFKLSMDPLCLTH